MAGISGLLGRGWDWGGGWDWRRSTIRVRWIWPVAAVRGRASTTARRRGCLNGRRGGPRRTPAATSRSGGFGAGPHDDDRGHDLAPLQVGYAHDCDLADRGMVAEHVLDLGRRDRLAAGPDDVAGAADDREVAVVVERPEIAGVVPAVTQRVGGGGGIVEVAVHQERAAHRDLAGRR